MLAALLLAAFALPACGGASGTGSTTKAAPPAAQQPAGKPAGKPAAAPAAAQPAPKGGAAKPVPVTIALAGRSSAYTYFYLARDLGIFAKHGLKVTFETMAVPTQVAAVSKGEATFMNNGAANMEAALRGLPLRGVYIAADHPPFALVGAPGVKSISQLKGKDIAVATPGSTLNLITRTMLARDGMRRGQYHILSARTVSDRVALLTNHSAAAALLDTALAVKLVDKGYPLIQSAVSVNLLQSGLATSLQEIRQHPGVVRNAIAACMQATTLLRTDKAAVTPVLRKEFGLNAAQASIVFDDLKSLWTPNGRPSQAALQFNTKSLMAALHLQKAPANAKLLDFSLLPAAGGGA